MNYFRLCLFISIIILFYLKIRERESYSTIELQMIHHDLKDLMKELMILFEENDIKYFIHSGTLLGAVRNEGIIPHDDDIDIAIFENNVEYLLSDEFHKKCEEKNIEFIPFKTNKGIIKARFIKKRTNNVFIDIFIFRIHGEIVEYNSMDSRNTWRNGWFHIYELFPLKHYSFEGMKLMGPHDPYPYLIRHYGRNWKIPKKHKKNHQKQIFKKT